MDQGAQPMSRSAQMSGAILLLIVLLGIWYSVAANYDYDALSGTYVFDQGGEKCILYLRPDQTFSEELTRSGKAQEVQGQWHRYGEAHVSFSSEFLKESGQELNAAGEAHGQFDKMLGLLPSLMLAPIPNGPTFHRKLWK
jgi:hypothetical protein